MVGYFGLFAFAFAFAFVWFGVFLFCLGRSAFGVLCFGDLRLYVLGNCGWWV